MPDPSSLLRSVHLADYEPVPPDVIALLPVSLVTRQLIVPILRKDDKLIVAVARTEGVVKPEGLSMITGCPVEFVLAPADELISFIKRNYPAAPETKPVVSPPENIVSSPVSPSTPEESAPPVTPEATILQDSLAPPPANDTLHLVVGGVLSADSPDPAHGISAVTVPPSPSVSPAEAAVDLRSYETFGDDAADLDPSSAALYDFDPGQNEPVKRPVDVSFLNQPDPILKETNATVSRDPSLIKEFIALLTEAVINRASEVWLTLKGESLTMRQRIRGAFVPMEPGQAGLFPPQATVLMDWVIKEGERHRAGEINWAELRKEATIGEDSIASHCFLTESEGSRVLTIRVHPRKEALFSPSGWGMNAAQFKTFSDFLERKTGMLLFAGSEQSDLTQNLHACAKHVSASNRRVIAVEASLESWLSEVEQFNSKGDAHVFSQLLGVAFKHAPDVVLAHPLENREQFEMCLSESLKGRLVIGRMHAADSVEALIQLSAMDVDPYLVGSALLCVVSKRPLRLNCPVCQEKDPNGRSRARELGLLDSVQPPFFYASKGCESCHGTGFSSETDIFEVIPLTPELRSAFTKNSKPDDLRSHIKSAGLLTLRQVALQKAVNGQTSLAEVAR